MKCACINVEVEDGTTFERIENRVAKKQHRCCECRRTIEIGEQYENFAGKWDAEFWCFKTCSDCLSIRKSFFCNGHEFHSILSRLTSHIEDMNAEISSDCLVLLTPNARALVCEMIEVAWKQMEEA